MKHTAERSKSQMVSQLAFSPLSKVKKIESFESAHYNSFEKIKIQKF